MWQTEGGRKTFIIRNTGTGCFMALLLVVSMLLFPLGGSLRELPDYTFRETGSCGQAGTSLTASSVIFQFMELSKEAGGVKTADTVKKASEDSRVAPWLAILFLLAALSECLRLLPLFRRERAFPFSNGYICSRRVILRYLERQDGIKIH